MGVGVHAVQRFLHRPAHADFVDVAHVVDVQAVLLHQPLLARIDRTDADLPHLARGDRRHVAGHRGQRLRTQAAQAGHRHAVDVAGRGDLARVEIGMRVQPQHAQLLAGGAAMRGHGGDRADAQAMVAAEQDRHPPGLQFARAHVEHRAVPGHDFVQVPIAIDRWTGRIARSLHVAEVAHLDAAPGDRLDQPGHPQRLRAHRRAPARGADVGGHAEHGHGRVTGTHRRTLVVVPLIRIERMTYRLQGGCSTS